MKTKLLILIALTGLAIAYTSCKKKCTQLSNVVNDMPEEIKIKQNEGDTLILKTETDDFDTIYVSSRNDDYWWQKRDWCYENNTWWSEYYEVIHVNYRNTDTTSFIKSLGTEQHFPGTNISIWINHESLTTDKIDEYQYKDSIYKNVYVKTNDSITLYFNNTHGILFYQRYNEEEFNLYKYIKNPQSK